MFLAGKASRVCMESIAPAQGLSGGRAQCWEGSCFLPPLPACGEQGRASGEDEALTPGYSPSLEVGTELLQSLATPSL